MRTCVCYLCFGRMSRSGVQWTHKFMVLSVENPELTNVSH